MFIEKYKNSLGKSKHRQSLFDHSLQCLMVADHIIRKFGKTVSEYSRQKMDHLFLSVFVHDVGKLDKNFQTMMTAITENKHPSTIVKHEGCSPQFRSLLSESEKEICQFIKSAIDWEITSSIDLDMVLSFAVTHHGIYYLSFENDNEGTAKRELLNFSANEIKRITLADLLFLYHPFGGLVIVADQLASYCHEKELDFNKMIEKAESYHQLLNSLLDIQEEINEIYDREKSASPNIKPMLKLLLGGI